MKETIEQLQTVLDDYTEKLNATLAERSDAEGARLKSLEATIEAQKARIDDLAEKQKAAETYALPGIEYGTAEKGYEDGISLARCVKLLANPSLAKSKDYGREAEMFKEMRESVDSLTPAQRKALNVGADSDGGWFMPNEVLRDAIIAPLQEETIIFELGASQMTGLIGTIEMVKNEGGAEAYHLDFESEERATASQDSFEGLRMVPHSMAARTVVTHGMMKQTVLSVESYIRDRMAQRFARRLNRTAFLGIAAGSEPRGIFEVAGVNTADFTSVVANGASQTITDVLDEMWFAPMEANYSALGGARSGWAMEVAVHRNLNGCKDADGRKLLTDPTNSGPVQSIYGAPLRSTQSLQNAVTTEQRLVYSADWREMVVGMWGVLQFRVGTEGEDLSRGRTTVVGIMDYDVGIKEPAAFCKAVNLDNADF